MSEHFLGGENSKNKYNSQTDNFAKPENLNFLDVAETLPHLIWLSDSNGYIVYCNQKIVNFVKAERLPDGRWQCSRLLHPDDLLSTRQMWKDAVSQGMPYKKEHRLQLQDGTFEWFESTAFPLKNDRGEIEKWYGLTKNIHSTKLQEKEAEAANKELLKTKNWLQMILNGISDGFIVLDKDFRFEYIGHVDAQRFLSFGLDAARMLNKIVWDVWPDIAATNSATLLKQVMKERLSKTCEEKFGDRWYEMHAYPNADGGIVLISPDITERKNAEIKLNYLDVLTLNIADAVIGTNPAFVITSWNKGAEKIYGWKKEEVIGKAADSILKTIFLETNERTKSKQKLDANLNWQGEVQQSHKDGYLLYILASVALIKDSNENVIGAVAINKDITREKSAEENLRYRTALLEAQNEATADAIMVIDEVKGKVLSYNKHFLELWKLPKSAEQLYDNDSIIAEVLEQVADSEVYLQQVNYYYRHTTEAEREEVKFKDGRIIERYGKAVIDEEGVKYGWAWFFKDISQQKNIETKLKESEERFRQLADLVPQIIWTARPDGYVDYFNSRWYQFTGFEEEQGGGDISWTRVLHPNDVQPTLDIWSHSVKTGEDYSIEYRFLDKVNDTYRWFLGKGLPIKDQNGIVTKWFGTCTDIHDQKTMAANLEQLVDQRTQELTRSNDDLQQFAHVASHDLKEPLRKIRMFAGRLENELNFQLPEKAKDYLEKINNAVTRMNSMIEGVLKYSTLDASEQPVELIKLEDILNNIKSDLEVFIAMQKGQIVYETFTQFEGASVLIHQLFYNLIYNSLKFCKPGVPPIIRVSSQIIKGSDLPELLPPTNSARSYISIHLKDNGIGFDQNDATIIFNTFKRLNSKDHYEGTGLGLSLCRKIAERHKGIIYAEGKKNEGAGFYVVLPLKQNHKLHESI